jgi:hypothetical protein
MKVSDQLLAADRALVKEEYRGLFSSLLWWQQKGRLSGSELSYIYIYIYIYTYTYMCVYVHVGR